MDCSIYCNKDHIGEPNTKCIITDCANLMYKDCEATYNGKCGDCAEFGCVQCKRIAEESFLFVCKSCEDKVCINCAGIVYCQCVDCICAICTNDYLLKCEECKAVVSAATRYKKNESLCMDSGSPDDSCKCGGGYIIQNKKSL